MARDHGRVLFKIWRDKEFRALPRTAQALYVQLLSQDTVNNAGVLPLMLSKWAKGCDEIGTSGALTSDLAALVDGRFIVVDTDTEEVLIRSFMRHDPGMKHPYIFKNALKVAQAVESTTIRQALAAELRRIRNADAHRVAEILDPSEPNQTTVTTASEWVPNAEVIPSESHSNPIETASESEIPFESHSDHCVVVEVEAEAETPVVGHLGGVAHAGARDADTREETPTPEKSTDDDPEPPTRCEQHLGGPDIPCGKCKRARITYTAWEAREQARRSERRRAEAQARSDAARQAGTDRARAIADCAVCDDEGQIVQPGEPPSLCDHRPPANRPSLREQYQAVKACQLCDNRGDRIPPPELADPPVAKCDHTPTMPAAWCALIAETTSPTEEKSHV